jgi:hypothetical protein
LQALETDLASPQVCPEPHLTDQEDVKDVEITDFFLLEPGRQSSTYRGVWRHPLFSALSLSVKQLSLWKKRGEAEKNRIFAQAI